MEDYLQSEEYKKYRQKMIDKEKTIINAKNAIHLDYLGEMLSDKEIKILEDKTQNVGLQLSRFDKSGVMYASLDQYTLITSLLVTQPLIENILIGAGGSATWDVIKYILTAVWRNMRNKTYRKVSGGEAIDTKITFGLKVTLDQNTGFDFELSGDFDEKIIAKSLSKVIKLLKEKEINKEYQHPKYLYYNSEQDEWIEIDVEFEIRKKILENKEKNKK